MTETEKRLYVWGSGGAGQLGLDNHEDYAYPQRFLHDQVVLDTIRSGGCHSTGFDSDGHLFMWGDNERNQLTKDKSEHPQVPRPDRVTNGLPRSHRTKLVACGWWSTLAVVYADDEDDGDRVYSWGANDSHQLGRTTTSELEQRTPSPLAGFQANFRVQSIACGWKHALLATADGQVFSWGSGRHGELALGNSITSAHTPMFVEELQHTHIVKVLCGWQHSVFQSLDEEVYTSGNNRHGQLGLLVPESKTSTRKQRMSVMNPQLVMRPNGERLLAHQVDSGWHFVWCLTTTGELVSWGKGSHGQLGHGTFEPTAVPTRVPFDPADRVFQIACGSEHVLVGTQRGELYTCGWGEHGNLGHGDTSNRSALEQVKFFTEANQHVISVAAGGAVSIALTKRRS